MIAKKELERWLSTLPADQMVAIDDGGLGLVAPGAEAHLEIGGVPEECDDDEPTYHNEYKCPDCGYEWNDTWDCGCDDECGRCGTKDISPVKSTRV